MAEPLPSWNPGGAKDETAAAAFTRPVAPSHLHSASGIITPALYTGMGPVDPQPRHATIG